jgi:hypothetical protein
MNWRRLITPALALSCMAVIGQMQSTRLAQINAQLNQPLTRSEAQRQEQQQRLSILALARFPLAGWNNLVADWAFLQFLQYFGDEDARSKTNYALAPDYFRVIIDRDPRFLGSYVFLSTSVSLYAGQPQTAVALMDQGLKFVPSTLPGAYLGWAYKATDEILFLGDIPAALKSIAKIIQVAQTQNTPYTRYVAAGYRQTAAFLASNPNSRRARINAWMMILSNALDDRSRTHAVERILELGGRVEKNADGSYRVIYPDRD